MMRPEQRRELVARTRGAALTVLLVIVAAAASGQPGHAQSADRTVIADVDLTGPFGTRSPWRLLATQGPPFQDEYLGTEPGAVQLCFTRRRGGACAAPLQAMATPPPSERADIWEPHFLKTAKVVWPRGKAAAPVLLVQTASLPSDGDGDQALFTEVLVYRRGADRFGQAYSRMTPSNNNQEARYVASGPLAGSLISVEPTNNAPFGYWITVNRLTPSYTLKPVLRYRSATQYGDGNTLAVIDSEMPTIQARLGLWRTGDPLPLPAKGCRKPRMIRHELWCSEKAGG